MGLYLMVLKMNRETQLYQNKYYLQLLLLQIHQHHPQIGLQLQLHRRSLSLQRLLHLRSRWLHHRILLLHLILIQLQLHHRNHLLLLLHLRNRLIQHLQIRHSRLQWRNQLKLLKLRQPKKRKKKN